MAVAGQVAEQSEPASDSSAGLGALAALVVLLLVFGSLLAALLPLVTAGLALGVGVSVIGLLSNLITMASFSSQLSILIGLGVGVDYALFIVTRHRQGLQQGKSVEEAIVDAIDTSGRAVMFAGITVCIALLGMFALGVSFLYGVAIAAAVVVSFTVLAALTLLPALLGLMGTRVLGRRARRKLASGQLTAATDGGRLLGQVDRRASGTSARLRARRAARDGRARAPVLLDAPRLLRRRLGPGRNDDAPGLRAARQGLRPRLQRAAAARREGQRHEPAAGVPAHADCGRSHGRGCRVQHRP